MSDLERRNQSHRDAIDALHEAEKHRGQVRTPIVGESPDTRRYLIYDVDPVPAPPIIYGSPNRRTALLILAGLAGAGIAVGARMFSGSGGVAAPPPNPESRHVGDWPYPELPWPEQQTLDVVHIRNNVPQSEMCIYGPTPEDYTIEVVDRLLRSYTSPIFPNGSPALSEPPSIWIDIPHKYRIDARFPLAFFIHESSAGTNPRWDGITQAPEGETSKSMGNISCTAGWKGKCYGRWRAYDTWAEGIEDWCKLMWAYARGEVGSKGQLATIEKIIPTYAPSFENNTVGYINTIRTLVGTFK